MPMSPEPFVVRPGHTAVLAYDAAALSGDAAARDVAEQLDAVEAALVRLGFATSRLPVDLDLAACEKRLRGGSPHLTFNLVESLGGSDRLQTLFPLFLEDRRIPFTGSGAAAMLLANHKTATKRRLAERGLPFPACIWLNGRGVLEDLAGPVAAREVGGAWIVKARDAHASFFLDDSSVVRDVDATALARRLGEMEARHGQPFFAERFVDGREFNISLVENAAGVPEVLPTAEISFAALPPDKPRLVGYAAKWEEDSLEYIATPRTFALGPEDAPLTERLRSLAVAAWDALGLAGYARVDFRVDAGGEAFILEANANPCLSPGAGLAAAAEKAGLEYTALVERIVTAALNRPA